MYRPVFSSCTMYQPVVSSCTMYRPVFSSYTMYQPVVSSCTMYRPDFSSRTMYRPVFDSSLFLFMFFYLSPIVICFCSFFIIEKNNFLSMFILFINQFIVILFLGGLCGYRNISLFNHSIYLNI